MTPHNTVDAERLRDCPFCGSAASFVEVLDFEGNKLDAVGCKGCGACGPTHISLMDDARPAAAASWNRRAARAEPQDKAERVETCQTCGKTPPPLDRPGRPADHCCCARLYLAPPTGEDTAAARGGP